MISVPAAVKLSESRILTSANLPPDNPKYIENKSPQLHARPVMQIVDSKNPPPYFTAGAVFAEDINLDKILYEKNADKKLAPASTTKIMTALVSVDHYKPGDVLVVPPQAMVGGSSMGLGVGESMTFRSLLYGMLLNSGNDAAYTLALNYPGGFDVFIQKMNEKASALGLKNTHFENPAGFDSPNHYSSASDLAKIAQTAVKNPQLAKIVSTKETSVESIDKMRSHPLKNLNKLLAEKGVLGVKTGFTEKAGENFVGLIERDGHKILTVVLSSTDRFGETQNLFDWIYSNFSWIQSS